MRTRDAMTGGAAALILALGASAAPIARAADLELPVEEKTLGNGLKVLVLEDHTVPNCVVYVWWRVGSRNELLGRTGIAHFFEHMMFRGGAKHGPKFDSTMEAAGGTNNAFTTRDVTVYQDWFPKTALPLILEMEKDRMSGMVFEKEGVKAERDVVASEWRSAFEEPSTLMSQALWATAFAEHPYRWEVLGWWNDVENWTQSDLEQFYAVNYAPNNATVVLVGDVNGADAMAKIEAALGAIPRRPGQEAIRNQEAAQQGERRVVLESTIANLPQVSMAWHIPRTSDPEFAVHEVLEALLLHGESGRLQRLLVEEEQICQSVAGGWQDHQFDPSLFTVDLVLRDGKETARAEELVYAEFAKLAKDGPAAREVEKAKNGMTADFVRRLKTINGKAELVGETDTFWGSWRELPKRVERIAKVTPEDVKRVAAKTFVAKNRTVVTLKLESELAPAAEPGAGSGTEEGGK